MSAGPTDASCTFCRIVAGELESCTVFEDETSVAFLDRRPLFHGHTLLVPRAHYETLIELPAELVGPIFANARLLARALERGLRAEGSFVALNNRISQSVPHLHVHVVPRRRKDGLRGFFWPRTEYESDEQMREVAETLRSTIDALRSSS